MKSWAKTKSTLTRPLHLQSYRQTTHTIMLVLAMVQNTWDTWEIFLSFPFHTHTCTKSYPHTHILRKCPTVCRHQIFNLPSPRFSQKSHYLPPSQSAISTMQQLDPPCQTSENTITPLLRGALCLLKKTIKEAPIHPSAERVGYPFPIFSSHLGR